MPVKCKIYYLVTSSTPIVFDYILNIVSRFAALIAIWDLLHGVNDIQKRPYAHRIIFSSPWIFEAQYFHSVITLPSLIIRGESDYHGIISCRPVRHINRPVRTPQTARSRPPGSGPGATSGNGAMDLYRLLNRCVSGRGSRPASAARGLLYPVDVSLFHEHHEFDDVNLIERGDSHQ